MTIEERIHAFFSPYADIPIEAWRGFAQQLQPAHFRKNDLIKPAGKHEQFLHFVISGSAGLFVYKDGHDCCIDLCYEGHFTGDYFSLLTQQAAQPASNGNPDMRHLLQSPSPIYVMALEKLETLVIPKEKLFALYEESELGNRVARMVSEVLYLQKQQQQIALLTQTVEERFRELLKLQPAILQRTAARHIASYLGITPESFSRLRKKHLRT